jgi:hypothetical protein
MVNDELVAFDTMLLPNWSLDFPDDLLCNTILLNKA